MQSARRLLEQRLREDPEDYDALDYEAVILCLYKEARLALRLLEEYLRYFPENAAARARYAWLLNHLGDTEAALTEIKATVSRHPENISAREWLLEWADQANEMELVRDAAREGLKYEPDNRAFLLYMARSSAVLSDENNAILNFRKLSEQFPDDEDVARNHAEFLLDINHSSDAARILDPFLQCELPSPVIVLRSIDAAFRARDHQRAIALFQQLSTRPDEVKDEYAGEAISLIHQNMGLQGGDDMVFRLFEERRLSDVFALEFLERSGQRQHRGHLVRIFKILSATPLTYPRTLARYLSTFYSAPLVPGTIGRWIKSNPAVIHQNTQIWGGVGAWYVQNNRFNDAIAHLSGYRQRPDAKPWMILLLGRAYEAVGGISAANNEYRYAITMPPDHSEASIRSRLAFNMALDDMPAAGHLILLECTERGKKLATVEDLVRIMAVEALAAAQKAPTAEAASVLFEQTMTKMKELARNDRFSDASRIIKTFKRKYSEEMGRMLSD